jgi:hypothetical protein
MLDEFAAAVWPIPDTGSDFYLNRKSLNVIEA